jgi:hypothetical protein
LRRSALAALGALAFLSACAVSNPTITAGELPEEQARAYLIFADELTRVRNVWKKPVDVCLAANDLTDVPQGGNLHAVWPDVLDRLRADNEKAEVKLTLESSEDCVKRAGTQDHVLVLAGQNFGNRWMGGNCKQFEGVLYAPPINRLVTYDFETRDGKLTLIGGDVCIVGWYRQ